MSILQSTIRKADTMSKNKLVIVGTTLLLSVIVYSSITSMSKSNDNTKGFEYYYNEDEASELGQSVGNNTIPALAHDTDGSTAIEVTKNAILDTNPESIGVFVNKEYGLPEDYIPSDLTEPNVTFSFNYSDEKRLLRKEAAHALENLFGAALEDGYKISGVSGYRSYKRQSSIYNRNLSTKGADYTNRYSAKPGFSEHQTGLSIDVSAASIGNRLSESFGDTEEGKWLAEHAHEYGFIIRYPKDKADITGYAYEPWHIRYLGVELATYLYENALTLEEYYNYTLPVSDENSTDFYDNAIDVDDPDDIIEDIPETNSSNQNTDSDKDTTKDKDTLNDKNSSKDKDTSKDNDTSNDKDTSKDKDTNKNNNTTNKGDSDKNTSTDKKPSSGNNNSSNGGSSNQKPDSSTSDSGGLSPVDPETEPDTPTDEDTGSSDTNNPNSDQGSSTEDGSTPSDSNTGGTDGNLGNSSDVGLGI